MQDITIAGMLYAKLKTSPHAHAVIKSIDTSKAEKLPGVKAVITGKEAFHKLGLYMVDRPVLAVGKVRHFGEAVAAVAAVDIDTAQRAIELIDVEYEPCPIIQSVEESIKPNSTLIHEDMANYKYIESAYSPEVGTNVANHFKIRKGDIESVLQRPILFSKTDIHCPRYCMYH